MAPMSSAEFSSSSSSYYWPTVTSTRPTDSAVRLAWPTGTGYAIVDRSSSLSEAGITSFLCFWMSTSYHSFYAQSAETNPKTGQKDGQRLRHKFSPRPHQ
eukprot:scaffold16709_cov53-Attheya_sp.AAC.1